MIQVGPDEKGDYEFLGLEGKDNDGDGLVNEDGYTFEYDPNRDWGWGWQPNYIQGGAYKYPFSFPENRACDGICNEASRISQRRNLITMPVV